MLFDQRHQELAAFREPQQARQRTGILADQRKVGAAPADGPQQRNEAADNPRRVQVLAQPQRQAGDDFGQPLPRYFVHPAVEVAVAQAVEVVRHRLRLPDAGAFQEARHVRALPCGRPALILFRAGPARSPARVPVRAAVRSLAFPAPFAALVEREPGELRIYELPMNLQFGRQRLPFGLAHRPGQDGPRFGIPGQALRLVVLHRLQAIFQGAQESIRPFQPFDGAGSKNAREFEPAQRRQQRAGPQRRILPAPHQLKHLHDELDFADAARTELDVVRQVAPGHFIGDQRLHLAQRAKHAEIDIAAVDEGCQHLVEQFGAVAPAGDEPGLLVGIALPVPAMPDQVVLQCRHAHRQRPAGTERPQARVHAERRAVRRRFVEQLDQPLPQAAEVLVRPGPGAILEDDAFRIQVHQVHVRRKVEFAAAQLAHGQDHHFHRRSVAVHWPPETLKQLRLRIVVSGHDGAVGQQGQVGEVRVQVRPSRQVPPREARHLHVAHLPEHRHRLGRRKAADAEPLRQAFRGERFGVRQAFQQGLGMAKQRGKGEVAADGHAGQRFRRPRMFGKQAIGNRGKAFPDALPTASEMARQIGRSGQVHRHSTSWRVRKRITCEQP